MGFDLLEESGIVTRPTNGSGAFLFNRRERTVGNSLPAIPDPLYPVFERRTIAVGNGEEGVILRDFLVEVLIKNILFLSAEPGTAKSGVRFERGSVLVRNLEFGRKLAAKNSEVKATDACIVYRNVYDALRGLRAIPPQYGRVEVKRIEAWQKTLRWMLMASWSLKDASDDAVAAFQDAGRLAADKEALVRDPTKVKVRERTQKAASVTDARGRKNPGRIPPLLWSSSDLLVQRQSAIRGISHRIDMRAYVLTCYLDRLLRIRGQYEVMVANLLGSGILRGKCTAPGTLKAMEQRLQKSAVAPGRVRARPFASAFSRVSVLLVEAAGFLSAHLFVKALEKLKAAQSILYFVDASRELEEILSALASYRDLGIDPTPEAWMALEKKVKAVRDWFCHIDFHWFLGLGKSPVEDINNALSCLLFRDEKSDIFFNDMYGYLRSACEACE